MELAWLPFSLATILFYGLGQVFVKETRTQISSANYLLLFSGNIGMIWAVYWLFFHESTSYETWAWIQAIVAAALSGAAYLTFYEALKHGKVSIIGTVAGAYAPWTILLALLFLGEEMTYGEGAGVALVVAGMLLFTYNPGNGNGKRTEKMGIVFEERNVPNAGFQMFLRDPVGNKVELDFPNEEAPAEVASAGSFQNTGVIIFALSWID